MENKSSSVIGRIQRIEKVNFSLDEQSKIRIEDCNLCGSRDFIVLNRVDRYNFTNSAVACRDCGLVFLNPVMTSEAYSKFYETTYRKLVSAYHGREISADTLPEEQEVYGKALCDFMEPFVLGKDLESLLDIGGSTGVVANELVVKFNLEATVLDPAPLEIDKAKQFGFKTITGMLSSIREEQQHKYDVIIKCQTIDHSLNIAADLYKTRKMISDHGLFFVDILDFRAVYLQENSISESIKPDHPFYLTEQTFEAFLKKSGFGILRTEYVEQKVRYLCQPCIPDKHYLPEKNSAREMLREIRYIQCSRA